MSRSNRYAYRGPPKPPEISEGEAIRRTIAAIKTLKALPDRERRFLIAGTKSAWVEHLVEWSDLVAQAEQPKDDFEPREKYKPSRADISDAMEAGGWFAKLALLPWNVQEFEQRSKQYTAGFRRNAWVDDQRILNWLALGFSVKLIGERLGLDEHQTERRIAEIMQSLRLIANGNARLAAIDERQRQRKLRQARKGGRQAIG